MKKILLLLTLSIGMLTVHAQTDTTKINIPDTAKLTFNRVYNDVKGGIEGLAKALKTGAEHVYSVLVRQQVVKAITAILVLTAFLIIFSLANYSMTRAKFGDRDKCTETREHKPIKVWDDVQGRYVDIQAINEKWVGNVWNRHATKMIIYYILSLLLLFFVFGTFRDIIQGFVNPEYGALKEIIEFVKK